MTAPKFCKTKIVATIGPSSWDERVLKDMIESGMDIARVNASFADFDELKRVKDTIHSISPRITMVLDTMGNKIRTTGSKDTKNIKKGDRVVLIPHSQEIENDNEIQITYDTLHDDITRDSVILIDDGNFELVVKDIDDKKIVCEAHNTYDLKYGKSLNIPNHRLRFPELTKKDIQDIGYALDLKYDFVALSFVQDEKVLLKTREILKNSGINIISKIENRAGLDNFDKILQHSDAIMIGRGDLGVEIPLEELPIIQKELIYRSRSAGKPVIVATQMLESMRNSIRPTRAEISDVANSIIDGADALMLSGETSTGKYPVESVEMMNRIALSTEDVLTPQPVYGNTQASKDTDELCRSLFQLVGSIDLKAVVVLSQSGISVNSLSRHRLSIPIFEVSNSLERIREDNLLRGVKCFFKNNLSDDRDISVKEAIESVFSYGELDFSDKIAIITGSSIKNKDFNTILEIATVKDIIK
jgi:pyruvate kinase